jgi:hypothetical protein
VCASSVAATAAREAGAGKKKPPSGVPSRRAARRRWSSACSHGGLGPLPRRSPRATRALLQVSTKLLSGAQRLVRPWRERSLSAAPAQQIQCPRAAAPPPPRGRVWARPRGGGRARVGVCISNGGRRRACGGRFFGAAARPLAAHPRAAARGHAPSVRWRMPRLACGAEGAQPVAAPGAVARKRRDACSHGRAPARCGRSRNWRLAVAGRGGLPSHHA